MTIKKFAELMEVVKGVPGRVVVPGANNTEVLEAIKLADENGLIDKALLIGKKDVVEKMASEIGLKKDKLEFIDCDDIPTMCTKAVELIKTCEGDFLVKGLVDTKFYMKAILNKETGIVEPGNLLSHLVLFENEHYHKLFGVSDAAILIAPTLEQKVQMIENSTKIISKLGIEKPKVSVVCPVEKVNPKIQSTLDAQELVKMNKEGKIKNAIVEGPYDIYISFSKKAAEEKGIKDGLVPGDADLLILPDLNSANPLYKAITFLGAGTKAAAIVTGASVPVILPSRADNYMTKLYSIALGAYLKNQKIKA
jgi:phosphate butyryltransferase